MRAAGFTLIEVLVALALVATTAIGLAELFVLSAATVRAARADTTATIAAETKMAQLRALSWTYDAAGQGTPVSDAGLIASPAGSLVTSAAGFVDYVDAAGVIVGAGLTAPPTAVYLRRWEIQPLAADAANTLVLQVIATAVTRPNARDVHLVSILARTHR
jgi:prepilin-type N-terminal cleavage/methylation domain-containing protein